MHSKRKVLISEAQIIVERETLSKRELLVIRKDLISVLPTMRYFI